MKVNYRQLTHSRGKWLPWLGGALALVLLAALWTPISHLGASPATWRQWIEQVGPLGPLVFYLLNVVQIVVAPIPGYPVQILGGILFGPILGSIYTVAGMVTGGVLAAWLGRRLGRPWLERRIGPDTLAHWSAIARVNAFWTWWVFLLIPLGDIPYFFAGLSAIRLRYFALAILTSRGPFTVLIVWLGYRAGELPLTWLALFAALVGLVIIAGFSQRQRIQGWGRAYVVRQAGAGGKAEVSSGENKISDL